MKTLLVKTVKTIMAAAVIAILFSISSDAATKVEGKYSREGSPELELNKEYAETLITEADYFYYSFKTNNQDGIYLIHHKGAVVGGQSDASRAYAASYVALADEFKEIVSFENTNKYKNAEHFRERGTSYSGDPALILNSMIYAENLEKNKTYYVITMLTDGSSSWAYSLDQQFYIEFIPYKAPSDFSLKMNSNGDFQLNWNNVQPYNTYSSLYDYYEFLIRVSSSTYNVPNAARFVGYGDAKSFLLKKDDLTLKNAGYPNNDVTVEFGTSFNATFHYNSARKMSISLFSDKANVPGIKKNSTYEIKGLVYKVTKDMQNGVGMVSVTGLTKANKNAKKVTISKTVKIQGFGFNVTEIAKKAFSGQKKMTDVTIGANVTKIGQSAFSGCTKLKKVDIKSKVLKSVGKNAFSKMSKKGTIKVPSKNKKAYTKLLKGKYTKGVVIK